MLSPAVKSAFDEAVALAAACSHRYATQEHLLPAFLDDPSVACVIQACNADPDVLRQELYDFLDQGLATIRTDHPTEPEPTAGCFRAVERVRLFAMSSGRETIPGPDIIAAFFNERGSHAAWFLRRQNMTRHDVVGVINYGIAKAETARSLDDGASLSS